MHDTFEAMLYIFNDVIDNKSVASHFKRLKVINFALATFKKLCAM